MKWKHVENLRDPKYIEQVEEEYGVAFPDDLKDIVIKYNRGNPVPSTFDIGRRKGKTFGELLNFNLDAESNILIAYSWIKDKLPPKVVPFTVTPGGDYLCFDYRKNTLNPEIVYWDHEQIFEIDDDILVVPDHEFEYEYYRIEFVANNLSALLGKLYGDEDDDDEHKETIWEDFFDEDRMRRLLSDESLAQVNARRALKNLPPILRDDA